MLQLGGDTPPEREVCNLYMHLDLALLMEKQILVVARPAFFHLRYKVISNLEDFTIAMLSYVGLSLRLVQKLQ